MIVRYFYSLLIVIAMKHNSYRQSLKNYYSNNKIVYILDEAKNVFIYNY